MVMHNTADVHGCDCLACVCELRLGLRDAGGRDAAVLPELTRNDENCSPDEPQRKYPRST